MISAKRALSISTEPDQEKRDALVDKLTEADAKCMLKVTLSVIQGQEWKPAVVTCHSGENGQLKKAR